MTTYLITIKTAASERDLYIKASSVEAAIAKARKTLTSFEARWASVFA